MVVTFIKKMMISMICVTQILFKGDNMFLVDQVSEFIKIFNI